MVSQLGNEEMAAVTAANIPVFIMTSLVFGLQSGLGILVSQYWGKRDIKNINRAMGVAAGIGAGIMLVLSLIFFFFPVAVMDLLSNRHALSLLGAPYLKWIGFAFLCNMLSSVYVSAQRSVGNPHFGMLLFAFSTVLNTLFNYVLIFGKLGFPALGVEGAAIATALAVANFLAIPINACAISGITGVLWAGGDVTRAMISDVTPQWVLAIPLTALTALVLHANCWVVAFAMQADGLLKVPLCLSRIHSRKWIHDVTVSKEEL